MAKRNPQKSFFMLTPNVRNKLLECKLTAAEWRIWCYLVSLDPFGDRGAKFSPAELMLKCAVKKSTYFAAKAKFQNLGLFDFQDGVTRVINLQGHSIKSKISDYSQQAQVIESKISESESKISESESKISESESEISESESEISDNQTLKPLLDKDSTSLQTLQTFQTLQTGEGEEKINQQKPNQEEVETNNQEVELTKQKVELLQIEPTKQEVKEVELTKQEVKKVEPTKEVREKDSTDQHLTEQIKEQLLSLGISLDKEVMVCIKKHHVSQVQKALVHIENTWEDIRNPRSVFLYQVPKQSIEKPVKNPLTPEFLDWYNKAIAQGIVVDRPAKTLPLNHFREPLVILPDGRQMDWQRVRDGDVQPLLSPSESGEFWAKIRAQLASKKIEQK